MKQKHFLKTEQKTVFSALAVCFLIFAASALFYLLTRLDLSIIIQTDALLFLLTVIGLLAALLRKSLRITLYSFKNIWLIAVILFTSVFTVVFLVRFLSGLGAEEISLGEIYSDLLNLPRTISKYALFLIFSVCILVGISNISLIRHEGLYLTNLLSLILAGFYAAGTFGVYFLIDFLTGSSFIYSVPYGDYLFVAIPLFLLLILCYFECILIGSAIMGWFAAHQVPSYDKDFIIILGCSIDKKGGLLPLLKGRVNRAIRYAWEQEIASGKPLKYVPSGGQGSNEIMSEGSAMELYLLSHGAEHDEVFPEKKSVNTWENMVLSKKIIDELKPDAKIAFATTNYHMLRSGIIAHKAGMDIEGIAGDTKWYFWPNGFVREFFGILKLNIKAHLISVGMITALCIGICLVGYLGTFLV